MKRLDIDDIQTVAPAALAHRILDATNDDLPTARTWVAAVIGAALAPTDAALGAVVVEDLRVPGRIRRALNVESGLNDGICVPLLLVVLAGAEAESNTESSSSAVRIVLEQIGYGAAAVNPYVMLESLDELKTLSDKIVTDGGTPWCAGIESGA